MRRDEPAVVDDLKLRSRSLAGAERRSLDLTGKKRRRTRI